MTPPDVHMRFHKEVTVRRSRLQENSCKETQEKYGNHREAGHPPTCDIAPVVSRQPPHKPGDSREAHSLPQMRIYVLAETAQPLHRL